MTFPCMGMSLSTGCLILGWVDLGLSLLSFFQWFNLLMESASFGDRAWIFYNLSPKTMTIIKKNCGIHYFTNYLPIDLGNQLRKSVVIFSLASMGYIIAGLFLIYSTISAAESSKILLEVFLFCQLILIIMSSWAAVLLQNDIFCIFDYDGVIGHEGRQSLLLALTFIFIFVYKAYELLVVICRLREINKFIESAVDPEITKMSYAQIRANLISTPSTSRSASVILDMDNKCLDISKEKTANADQDNNNNNLRDSNGNNLYLDPEVLKLELSVVGQSLTRCNINEQRSTTPEQGQASIDWPFSVFTGPTNFYSPFQHSEYE